MIDRLGLYDQMLAFSTEPRWYVWPDTLVTPDKQRPTRDELIAGYMSIPVRVMTRRAHGPGYAQDGETTYATREEAERAVAPYVGEERKAA